MNVFGKILDAIKRTFGISTDDVVRQSPLPPKRSARREPPVKKPTSRKSVARKPQARTAKKKTAVKKKTTSKSSQIRKSATKTKSTNTGNSRKTVAKKKPASRATKKKTSNPRKSAGSAKTSKTPLIGEITHYFSKIKVAVVKVTGVGFKVGDQLNIKGKTTDTIERVYSMQIESVEVKSGRKGQLIGVKLEKPVKVGDKVYKSS